MIVSTAGGLVVWRGVGSPFVAAQVRGLVKRGYPAFVRDPRVKASAEILCRDGSWVAEGTLAAQQIVDVLNETEEGQGDQ